MEKKGSSLSGGRGLVICVILFGFAGFWTYKTLTTAPPPVAEPVEAIFMCSETGATFPYAMHEKENWPVMSPFTNKKTGYPAERCYWTKDGKRKATPTYVILNEHLGKSGDTICPECGRVVIGHNPPPPPDTPLAAVSPAAPQPSAPKTGAPVAAPAKPAPTPAPTATPSVGALPTSQAAVMPAGSPTAGTEQVVYATIRAKMDQMVQQRAQFLKSGKNSSDPEVRQLEESILKARQALLDHGEVVGEVVPPLPQPAAPGK